MVFSRLDLVMFTRPQKTGNGLNLAFLAEQMINVFGAVGVADQVAIAT